MDKRARPPAGAGPSASGLPLFKGFNPEAMRLAMWPVELWLQWQADMLRSAAPAMADWVARRREGTEAALHALERLCTCEDMADASKIQSEWIEEETKRLETDMRAFADAALVRLRPVAKAAAVERAAE
jgi:hypothetical protein